MHLLHLLNALLAEPLRILSDSGIHLYFLLCPCTLRSTSSRRSPSESSVILVLLNSQQSSSLHTLNILLVEFLQNSSKVLFITVSQLHCFDYWGVQQPQSPPSAWVDDSRLVLTARLCLTPPSSEAHPRCTWYSESQHSVTPSWHETSKTSQTWNQTRSLQKHNNSTQIQHKRNTYTDMYIMTKNAGKTSLYW